MTERLRLVLPALLILLCCAVDSKVLAPQGSSTKFSMTSKLSASQKARSAVSSVSASAVRASTDRPSDAQSNGMEPTFTIGETPPFYPEETAGSLGTVQEAANLWRSDSPKGVPVLWFTFDTTRGWLWTAGVAPAASSSTSQSTAGSEQGWTSVSNSMAGDGPHHGKDIGAGNKLLLRALHKWSKRTHSGHSQGVDFSPLPFLISEISVFVKGQRLLNAFPELMQVADLFHFENRLQKASSLLADSLQKGLFSNETNGALHAAVIKASQSQRKPFAAAATYISVFVLSMKKLFHAKTSSEASKVLHGVTSASTRASTIANAVLDPAPVRKSIGDPSEPQVEEIAVPGGKLLGVRAAVWSRRIMPDPRNPRSIFRGGSTCQSGHQIEPSRKIGLLTSWIPDELDFCEKAEFCSNDLLPHRPMCDHRLRCYHLEGCDR